MAGLTTVDVDAFHAMALFRRALQAGRLPLDDAFAYTPTVFPVVHHEWGTGAVLWALWEGTGWGPAGLSALRYALLGVILAGACLVARWRGATAAAAAVASPMAGMLLLFGASPVRGQLFTLALLTVLLVFLEADRRGARWWIAPWLPLCLAWTNLHGGYVVGLGALALAIADRAWAAGAPRAAWKDVRHLLPVLAAMCGALLLTPYGVAYPRYLLRALTMPRPGIMEWLPVWAAPFRGYAIPVFGMSPALVAYAVWKTGVRAGSGLPLLAVLAVASLFSSRHLSLYAIAFVASSAPALAGTELALLLARSWGRRPWLLAAVALLCLGLGVWKTVAARAWRLRLPDRGAAATSSTPWARSTAWRRAASPATCSRASTTAPTSRGASLPG